MVKRNKIAYNLKVYSARKVAPPVQSSLPCDFDVSFTAQQGTIKMKENCVKKSQQSRTHFDFVKFRQSVYALQKMQNISLSRY